MRDRDNIPDSRFDAPKPQELPTWSGRAILLIDLDAFFASVEQLDHPAWRGKPVIVGGHADKHGVVSTCSYEARKFGVRSAMPASTAARICPEAIWTRGRFNRYRELSNVVMDIIRDETPLVQQVSIDEAFADITPNRLNREHPVLIAMRIQGRVKELGVTCSIGLGTSKTIAKIASDLDKPEGLTVVFPGTEKQFLSPLPIRKMSGIGPSAEKLLHSCSVRTLGDLANADQALLKKAFGINAEMVRNRASGKDDSQVTTDDEVKSISHEITFAEDLTDEDDIKAAIETIASKVGRRLRIKSLEGSTIAVKVRYEDRSIRSAQCKMKHPSADEADFFPYLHSLVKEVWAPGMKIRLVGVSVTNFENPGLKQMDLFEENDAVEDLRRKSLVTATDRLKDKFGENIIKYGRDLRNERNSTGSPAKNPFDYK